MTLELWVGDFTGPRGERNPCAKHQKDPSANVTNCCCTGVRSFGISRQAAEKALEYIRSMGGKGAIWDMMSGASKV